MVEVVAWAEVAPAVAAEMRGCGGGGGGGGRIPRWKTVTKRSQ